MTARQIGKYDLFVGIDWSGAKDKYLPGLAVFAAKPGQGLPKKILPPSGKLWSRQDIRKYLRHEAIVLKKRLLAGIDFAFAYPVTDDNGQECGYFPGYAESPKNARDLWDLIDKKNEGQKYLHGGGIWDDSHLRAYYLSHKGKGCRYRARLRRTEQEAKSVGITPSPAFKCIGAGNVGTGSLAGMRLLRHLSGSAHIWPFDNSQTASRPLHLVEIWPSYYFALAGVGKGEKEMSKKISQALPYFKTESLPKGAGAAKYNPHEADALVSAAALRWLADRPEYWETPDIAQSEGWIFGVK